MCPQPAAADTPAIRRVAVVGGGPAGLMAAEVLRAAGADVDVFEAKGSVGRKFLIAGKGGLNLTHSDSPAVFAGRYGARAEEVARWLATFDADALREWARGLGVETFVGSSGRVFPADLKAAPLLRGWVRRLRTQGVAFHVQHRWCGWDADGALRFETPDGARAINAHAAVLALGGGSWPQLGSDGAWQDVLRAAGVALAPLQPSNCGFDIAWSAHFSDRHAGAPLKPLVLHWLDLDGTPRALQGEAVVSAHGIEGSVVYAASATLRDLIARDGRATVHLDLTPDRDEARLLQELSRPRGKRSIGEHLRRTVGITGAKAGLLREVLGADAMHDAVVLAAAIKRLPLVLRSARPLEEAISSAGGVRLEAVDAALMLDARPGTFVAGEMLDWEAPTGGYLLTACFASGLLAAQGALHWLGMGAAEPAS
ncbi:TIGR03862 family flavoprotein [Luteimonas sp. MC1572]|uniref:TIGR03862 family flavoprotein n=1 Tax=Luteimonas sp. MC1572 TaxID=2799325 RepID=UPI0018F05CB7|nr:TIGR03862 family flavoprotein [Luteimonas sp. MC1572]MBJ6980813.1 TIGR03862 family flavoprotein [Luteimonas sp. MC1572]QQO02178.1 TIGR03862 family flavoprotein [Luteimonas sp. MC1572]